MKFQRYRQANMPIEMSSSLQLNWRSRSEEISPSTELQNSSISKVTNQQTIHTAELTSLQKAASEMCKINGASFPIREEEKCHFHSHLHFLMYLKFSLLQELPISQVLFLPRCLRTTSKAFSFCRGGNQQTCDDAVDKRTVSLESFQLKSVLAWEEVDKIRSGYYVDHSFPAALPSKVSRLFQASLMADKNSERAAKIASALKRDFDKLNVRYNVLPPLRLVPVSGGDRTCHWKPDTLFIYTDALNAGLRESFPLSVAVFRKIFQCYNSSSSICGWVYVKQRPKCKHIFNSASIPDNNQNWRNSFVGLRWENGNWGTLFRSSFGNVSDGSLKSIHLTPEETIIYNELTRDDAAKEINEDNVPPIEETSRMKKARLAGLDTRGKATEPIFLQKHNEPMGEASVEGAEAPNAPITVAAPASAATGAFQPLWGFRRGDIVVGSTKHAWDWSYHGVTPKDFTDVVATPNLERIKLMGAQSLASSNAYVQGAVRQADSWKRDSDKADNALKRQQKKYAALEKKFKRKEEKLGESKAELVVLRAEKDKAIDNYLDSEEFTQSMRIRDDSVFPGFFRTGLDTALGTVNEACPDINPVDYICPDDEALLQRFHTRVVVSDHIPQDPLLPPHESSSRPAEDDSSSSSSETTETSSERRGDDDMDAEGTSAP
ncbi:hypothetical protein AgCh_000616 [Apium graveolens]